MPARAFTKHIALTAIVLNEFSFQNLATGDKTALRPVTKSTLNNKNAHNTTHFPYSRSLEDILDQRSIIEEVFGSLGLPISSENECTWPSIICVEGVITGLRLSTLSSSSASGTISSKIGMLSSLEVLSLRK